MNGSGGLNPPVFKVDNPSCTRNFWPLRGIGVTPLLPCVRLLTLIMWQNKLPADLKIQESRSADPTGGAYSTSKNPTPAVGPSDFIFVPLGLRRQNSLNLLALFSELAHCGGSLVEGEGWRYPSPYVN